MDTYDNQNQQMTQANNECNTAFIHNGSESQYQSPVNDTSVIADGVMVELPLNVISVEENFNHRTYFDKNEQDELTNDIKLRGVMQPILIRPDENNVGHYKIICGERRYRSACQAGLLSIPCKVSHLDRNTALAHSLAENHVRSNPTPVEEATVVHTILSKLNGDKRATASQLGWPLPKVNARLLLLNCSDKVKTALNTRKISVSQAEVFSALPCDLQDEHFQVILDKKISASKMKSVFDGIKGELSTAIFDKTQCQGCQYNSSIQADVFDAIDKGDLCSKSSCYKEKTQEAILLKKKELEQEYSVVFLDSEKTEDDYVLLTENQVGNEQFGQCQQCSNYGALLQSNPGSEGVVLADQCFDISCFIKCKSNYLKEIEQEREQAKKEQQAKKSKSANQTVSNKSVTDKKKTTVSASPTRVLELTDKFTRSLASEAFAKRTNPTLPKVFALFYLLRNMPHADLNTLLKGEYKNLNTTDEADFISRAIKLDEALLDDLTEKAIQAHFIGNKDGVFNAKQKHKVAKTACQVIDMLGVDVKKHFIMNKEFLSVHTKKGIKALMEETNTNNVSFPQWYDNFYKAEKKTFNKLINGEKVGDIVNTIINSDYDFTAFVPVSVSNYLKNN